MKTSSISFKITIWYIAFLVIISVLLMAVLVRFNDFRERNMIERKLMQTVEHTASEIADEGEHFKYDRDISYYTKDTYISVYDEAGELVTGRRPRGFDSFPPLDESETQIAADTNGGEWYVYDTSLDIEEDRLFVRGMMNNQVYENDNFLLWFVLAALPVLIFLAAAGGMLISRRALAPLRELNKITNEIRSDADLSRRVPVPQSGDEVQHLAESFNGMFSRIEEVVSREKQFTSDVSHELRTPLTVIRTQSEYAMEDPEYAVSAAKVINRESRRLTELISRLLTIARSDAGRLQLELTMIDMEKLLADIAEQAEIRAADRDITIEYRNGADGRVLVKSDEDLLLRVILNLIENAVKYGRTDGGTVLISLRKESGDAVCTIVDDGEGIPEEECDKIWQRFYRVDESRSRRDSTGLGLAMVASLTSALGGSIRLLSDEEAKEMYGEDTGAAFELRLPLAQDNAVS